METTMDDFLTTLLLKAMVITMSEILIVISIFMILLCLILRILFKPLKFLVRILRSFFGVYSQLVITALVSLLIYNYNNSGKVLELLYCGFEEAINLL